MAAYGIPLGARMWILWWEFESPWRPCGGTQEANGAGLKIVLSMYSATRDDRRNPVA